ncbi:HEAT repeat domain-containing protein [Natrarchaeobius oligotrophus]|uniref:HEAT repeat domain-containing protein n=1 Tax=Natrarchaeobius chitinivorans TaxID=1679083 RepID=A0A3N6M8G1_NATCH|nr:HEAT repeat domain-containing protein [Natrarchaeobius chitinivorans]RQG99958.1 HEAT repeat domain-containing protein [Natrarchaeobius chitinivorans]
MDGDGESHESDEHRDGSDEFDLPSVLARLDDPSEGARRDAVQRVRRHVDERPERVVPTVPKLRQLLGESATDCHEEIAYCLAELADESVDDVAPSIDGIVAFLADDPTHAATSELLRCLATVAADRPAALVDHAETIAAALEERDGYDVRGIETLARLSSAELDALEPAAVAATGSTLVAGLEADEPAARAAAADAVGRVVDGIDAEPSVVACDGAEVRRDGGELTDSSACGGLGRVDELLSALATDDPDPTVRERAAWAADRLP